jgi:hypothetical protein
VMEGDRHTGISGRLRFFLDAFLVCLGASISAGVFWIFLDLLCAWWMSRLDTTFGSDGDFLVCLGASISAGVFLDLFGSSLRLVDVAA